MRDVSPVVVLLMLFIMQHLCDEYIYGLFNICAFAIFKFDCLYSNQFLLCVIGFDIIQD